ncbi:hypothetical protein WSK_3426 [Novosphingobium sp. Rr 2-17]|uniref:hypothetical protein n=1 Tax=Novosphingobium sp. Rr 2-17 TaxID=555793 RepID=UPI00026998D3|nr:hypothetical protein [Novosphingobium sp. Rr 2-17]EIZ77950.1 hypothetical protein WSK_3426 [Novosphingobium sp. Rr 2-17]
MQWRNFELEAGSGRRWVDLMLALVPSEVMHSHTRAIIAAAAFAFVTGKKVAGMYDHSGERDLLIAAEIRGDQLQGFDGDRGVKFGGTPPEIYDAGDETFVSFEIDGTTMKGYDRGSSSFYEARVGDGVVQVFDHDQNAWFAYDIQNAQALQSYYRTTS